MNWYDSPRLENPYSSSEGESRWFEGDGGGERGGGRGGSHNRDEGNGRVVSKGKKDQFIAQVVGTKLRL